MADGLPTPRKHGEATTSGEDVHNQGVICQKIEPIKSLKETWYKSDVSQLKYCVEKAMETYTSIKVTKIEERDNA